MAEVKTEQEPSIEEILESIRQIISEDTEDAKNAGEIKLETVKEAPVPPSNLSLAPKPEAPVAPSNLSLAPAPAPVEPAPVPLSLKPAPQPVIDNKPAPLDLTDKITPVAPPAPEPAPPITIDMMDSPMTDNDKASSLVSAETASAVTDSLSKILAGNVAVETERSSPAGKVTLEDMTRDLMKPLLKTWLDQNLPGIIEKAVQKEVEKLSRRAERKSEN